jgi:hypothetical protein
MSPEITKIIEQYLQNELSEADRAAFDKKLAENDRLLNEVVLQKRLHEAAKRASVRTLVTQTARRYHIRKQLTTAAIAVIAATVVAAATWLAVNRSSDTESSQYEAAFLQLTERLDRSAPMEGIDAQYFNLAKEDTVVLSQEGVLLSIPEGAFLLHGKPYAGPKVVQWQEAVRASDIVQGGLSTMSGDKLLETQGMFGLQAFTPGGEQLDVNPKVGVYVQVPVDELKNGMMLFEGKKDANGVIDWQNPQPLEKLPIMADMSVLDFYPPGYEAELNRLKWKTGKKDRDSLYLSMEEQTGSEYEPAHDDWNEVAHPLADTFVAAKSTGKMREYMGLRNTSRGDNFYSFEVSCSMKSPDKARLQFSGTVKSPRKLEGKGPRNNILGLKTGNRDLTIRHYGTEVRFDGESNKIVEIYDIDLHNPGEISATGEYRFEAYDPGKGKMERIGNEDMKIEFVYADPVNNDYNYYDGYGHIPPSMVLGFWSPKFNNTILATRDFERRMKTLHHTCDRDALAKYTDNLNKPLYEIDAMVAGMGYPQFSEFASERVGAVKLDNPHMNNLRQFYDRTAAQFRNRAKKDRSFIRKQELAYDNMLNRSREQENRRTAERDAQSLQEETDFNMASAMRQLGKKNVGFTIREGGKAIPGSNEDPPANVYNVDRFVVETTIARKTGTFTDSETGKTATIAYNDLSVSVKDPGSYGRLMLYLFPRELNSFQRIDPEGGKFSYSLNGGMTYDIAVVGIGESGHFIYEQRTVKSGDLGSISLKKVSEAAFNNRIEALSGNSTKNRSGIMAELDWLLKEQQNYKVQRLRMENEAFRQRIRGVVFPCSEAASPVAAAADSASVEYILMR